MNRLKQAIRSVQKPPKWLFYLPAKILQCCCYLLYRHEIIDPTDQIHNSRGRIVVAWHNRLLFFPILIPLETRKRTMAVVSASRDGEYLSALIGYLGLQALRGSSRKQGLHAQLGAIKAIQDQYHVVFTPDGPRGPKYTMSKGPIHLAGKTGAQILPLTINASKYWQLKSWDNFQIPKPGAKLTLVIGDPIQVPPDPDAETLEKYRRQVEDALKKLTVDVN